MGLRAHQVMDRVLAEEAPITRGPLPYAIPIRVLVVEDNPVDARLLVEMLRGVSSRTFVVKHVRHLKNALEHVATIGADVVLLDLGLPDGSGLETFERMRTGTTETPIVIISALDDERLALEAVHAGAQDYLMKGRIDRELLARVIHYAIERQHAQQVLRTERDRAQRYLDTADVILLALDLDGRVTLINRKGCDLLGWTERELVGQDWIRKCLPTRTWDARRDMHSRLLGGDLSIIENPVVTKSGEERLIEWRNVVLRDEAGCVTGTFSSGSDITERKQAEWAMREERDRAQQYLDTAEAILLALDMDGRVTLANRYACSVFGWKPEELIGRDFIDTCVPLRLRRETRNKLGKVRGEDSVVEPIVTKSGAERLIEWRTTLLRDREGCVVSTLSSGTDITERAEAVDAVRAAEERMRFALQNADVGIWDMDYTTGVLRWSETLEGQYGLQPGTFAGTFEAFVERIHPDDRQSVLDVVGKAMRLGTDFVVSNRTICPDGTVRWLSGAGRILLDQDGQPVRGVGISQDVTERRTLEAQFQQAQKMEAIGRLAGGVAHDFNNLLTAILGYCELLLADFNPNDPRRGDIGEIQKAGLRAAGLTRQLLTFSRKQIIEPTQLDLNAIVSGMRPMLGRLIGEDVTVVLGLPNDVASIMADHGQIEQVILNLAVNARDAMPKGGTLTIETANVDLDTHYAATRVDVKPGCYVALTVSDTGGGMTPEVKARLFEPFFTTKAPGKGTGLGLASVHGIVKRAGGSVAVYSEVGRGTSFTVYFPRVTATDTIAPAEQVVRPRVGTETVLVVEDADGLRALAKRLLERQGYNVLVAANAEEAMRLFERQVSIDVVLTDVVMPGGSGPELTRQLIERRPTLKVIYMSGYTEDAIVHHGVLNPGIAFLQKPFTAEALGLKIREVLDRSDYRT